MQLYVQPKFCGPIKLTSLDYILTDLRNDRLEQTNFPQSVFLFTGNPTPEDLEYIFDFSTPIYLSVTGEKLRLAHCHRLVLQNDIGSKPYMLLSLTFAA